MSRRAKALGAAALAVTAYAAASHTPATRALLTTARAPAGATSSGANVALARQMAATRGWTGAQWDCLDWLWTRESGFRLVWNYQGSGAYGIPQALPASKMATAGSDWLTSPVTQIRWGLGYIQGRYGTPCQAWAHETAVSWY